MEDNTLNIDLAPNQQELLTDLVAAGRFSSVGEAVREGVQLLISREDLRRQVQLGVEQADRGDLVDHDTVFAQLRKLAGAADDSARQ